MKKVISASRRVDMVANAPDQFVTILNEKCPPERVHTLVIWTKNARNLFDCRPLYEALQTYDQLFIHYTVTGMGSTLLEPHVPPPAEAMSYLDRLVKLAGDPRRIRFRFDPIVHLQMPDGSSYSNIDWWEKLAPRVRQAGISDVSISWMSEYRKVIDRLLRSQIRPMRVTADIWQRERNWLMTIADQFGLKLHGCCVPGMPRSRCIDGQLLMELHPHHAPCSLAKAKGQRASCGCTESWDIGWYHSCKHGCRYCYANPMDWSDPGHPSQ
ncbi:MAG: DUF1848 domain-containing protein [candidate division KSB1 bacterium]|nr:DUF1848 domain-containing protein [candidate division KSB1 bacterium]MDZ7341611.1 DUF1848 domain-containing protein [candidate division KSB1 bacterium]